MRLFKKGDRLDHENYRGISLSNLLSKVFAKILCRRIDSWIDQNKILSDSQAGFRKGYSPKKGYRPGHSKRNYRLGHRDTNDDWDMCVH